MCSHSEQILSILSRPIFRSQPKQHWQLPIKEYLFPIISEIRIIIARIEEQPGIFDAHCEKKALMLYAIIEATDQSSHPCHLLIAQFIDTCYSIYWFARQRHQVEPVWSLFHTPVPPPPPPAHPTHTHLFSISTFRTRMQYNWQNNLYLQIIHLKCGIAHSPFGMHWTSGVPLAAYPTAHWYVRMEPIELIFGGIGMPFITGGSTSHPIWRGQTNHYAIYVYTVSQRK